MSFDFVALSAYIEICPQEIHNAGNRQTALNGCWNSIIVQTDDVALAPKENIECTPCTNCSDIAKSLPAPCVFWPLILGREGFYGLVHYATKPRLWRGQSCRLSSSYSSTAPVHARSDPAAMSRHSGTLPVCHIASFYY